MSDVPTKNILSKSNYSNIFFSIHIVLEMLIGFDIPNKGYITKTAMRLLEYFYSEFISSNESHIIVRGHLFSDGH